MAIRPKHFQVTCRSSAFRHWFVCIKTELSNPSFHIMGTRPRVCGSGCIHHQLKQVGYNICISTFQFDPEDAGEAAKGPSGGAFHHTTLAHSWVVSTDAKATDMETNPFTLGKGNSSVWALRCSLPPTQIASASGSLLIRKAVQVQGIQGRTREIICVSWRESIKRKYASHLSCWNQFCAQGTPIPFIQLWHLC